MELNSSSSRLALIDAPGMLTLLDLEVRIPEDEDRYVMFCYVMSCHVITLNVYIFYFILFIYNFLIYLHTIFLLKICFHTQKIIFFKGILKIKV